MTAFRRTLAAGTISVAAGAFAAVFFNGPLEYFTTKRGQPSEPTVPSTVAVRQVPLREAFKNRFEEYVGSQSRHSYTLLQEVVSCYMRADPAECLDLLRSMNALTLVSSRSLSGIDSQVDQRDFATLLGVASNVNQQTAGALITKGFRELILSDPLEAFKYVSSLPLNLRNDLAAELAESWGRRDGPDAANAFYNSELPFSVGLCATALTAWAQTDLQGAYRHLMSLDVLGEKLDRLLGAFVGILGQKDARLGLRLLREHGGDMPEHARSGCRSLFRVLASQDGEAALGSAGSLPTDQLRYEALRGIVSVAYSGDSLSTELALRAAAQLPINAYSLKEIRTKTADIAKTSADPFSLAERLTNPHQREAAADGVVEAIVKRKGVAGVTEIISRGLSSKHEEWLEAAGSFIVAPKAHADSDPLLLAAAGGNQGNPEKTDSRDWKLLPLEVKNPLLTYANKSWTSERVAVLRQKLGQ